jgi:multidrug efflux pump subunit AcrA (membrane-fusion protein)
MNEPKPSPPTTTRIWPRLRLVLLVPLARLRFLFILAAIGVVIVKWDWLAARYERWFPAQESAAAGDYEYFCPMHPTVVRENRKDKCPICGMNLSRRKKTSAIAGGGDKPLPDGVVSRVQLTPYRVVLAGAQTEPIAYQPLTKEINVAGTVEFDERGLKTVAARVKGRIDELFVNQTGQLVDRRERLASVYSPELVVTVESLLAAHAANNVELEKNAIDRLSRWGIDKEEIDKIIAENKPIRDLTIRSPIKGHIIKKYVREGQYVEEGAPLYDVADISTVWVQAQLYEDDLAFLPKGTHSAKTGLAETKLPATARARAFPGRDFVGTLSFVFPHLDPDSRTLTVRFVLDNPEHELRPGTTVAVSLKLDALAVADRPAGRGLQIKDGNVLAVQERAVIDTGDRKLVYREEVPNTYVGVLVELGPRMTGPDRQVFYPVLKGLEEHDRVVTSGSFLIDAETRLNSAIGSIYVGGSSSGKNTPTPTVRESTPDDPDLKINANLRRLSPTDRKLVVAQRMCPIAKKPLGSMGVPIKVKLGDKVVFVCCDSCIEKAENDAPGTLAKAKEFLDRFKK